MFESLDSVDWGSLQGCYDPADEMPQLLRSLLSPMAEIREWAIEEIGSAVIHQGTVYPVSPVVLPLLFELLENDQVDGKDDIVCLVAALAGCRPYLETNVKSTEERSRLDAGFRAGGSTFDSVLQRERALVEDIRSQITKRFDLIYPYLRSADDFLVRLSVAGALCEFPEIARRLRADLEHLIDAETHADVRSSLAAAMATP